MDLSTEKGKENQQQQLNFIVPVTKLNLPKICLIIHFCNWNDPLQEHLATDSFVLNFYLTLNDRVIWLKEDN